MKFSWSRRGRILFGALSIISVIVCVVLMGSPWQPRKMSIVGKPFLALFVVLIVTAVVTSAWFRHWWARWALRLLSVVLFVGLAAASVNAWFTYLPTVDALLGRRAADQVSAAEFQRLESTVSRSSSSGGTGSGGKSAAAAPVPPPLPAKGVVLPYDIPATASGFNARTAQVYLPPAWFQNPRPSLPVIELLHGAPGAPADWTRGAGADVTADAYAKAHNGVAPIIVMPDPNGSFWDDTECVDGPQAKAETYLVTDVRNAIVQRFAASPDGASWAIAGLSEGGYCAATLALRHPGMFAAAGDFAGDDHAYIDNSGARVLGSRPKISKLFSGTPEEIAQAKLDHDDRVLIERWRSEGRHGLAMWFSAGTSDRLGAKLRHLAELAQRAGLDARFSPVSGGHDFGAWKASFGDAMPWLVDHLTGPAAPAATVRADLTGTHVG